MLPVLSYGQHNLVPNGDFEQYNHCPEDAGQWYSAIHWSNANGSSPDYYHSCAPPLIFPPDTFPHVGTPINIFGYQTPYSGNAYMGLYAMQLPDVSGREYIQVELTDSLIYSIRYMVSFYASLAEGSRYALSTLGAHLSKEPLISNSFSVFDVEPQILNDPLYPIVDTIEWTLITDTFLSRFGGERYLTIGNFHIDAQSDTLFFNSNPPMGNRFAYYYIDDVSVIALDSIPDNIEGQEQLSFSVWPNPASDVLHIQSRMPFARLRLLDISGRAVLSENMVTDRHTLQLAGIPPGLYLLEATDTEGRSAVRKVVVQ
jgi:OOP family OmpA-OmpF porin